jgi:MerR family redox-sensitive transcriptional activator SoxR
MKELSIGDVAEYAGVQPSAIRYYESVGLLEPPRRVSGQRRYDPGVLKRLGLIQLLRDAGFGIKELQVLFSDLESQPPAKQQWQTLAVEKVAELDALIKRTQATRAWLVEALQQECSGVEDCVSLRFENTESGTKAILTCEHWETPGGSTPRKGRRLVTLPLPR